METYSNMFFDIHAGWFNAINWINNRDTKFVQLPEIRASCALSNLSDQKQHHKMSNSPVLLPRSQSIKIYTQEADYTVSFFKTPKAELRSSLFSVPIL